MKIHIRVFNLVFSVLIALLMACCLSFAMIAIYQGFDEMFLLKWLGGFFTSLLVSVPISIIIIPLIRTGLSNLFEIDYGNDAGVFNKKFFVKQYDTMSKMISGEMYSVILKYIKGKSKSGKILDIGCGTGVGTVLAAKDKNYKLTGVDASAQMIKMCYKNAAEAGLSINFKIAKATELPFPDNSFDIVISNGSMHHWQDLTKAFCEIYRVLKPNGYTFINDFFKGARNEDIYEVIACKIDNKMMQEDFLKNAPRGAFSKEEILQILQETPFRKPKIEQRKVSMEVLLKK